MIDLTRDKRRHATLQRIEDESKSYQDALNSLIECIRDDSSSEYRSLLVYIRGGASNQDVIDHMQHSPAILADDSENTSPLQNYIKGSSSPPDVQTDPKTLLQTQPSIHLPTLNEVKHMDNADFTNNESSSPFGVSEAKKSAQGISSVISTLKLLPKTEREQLLGQIFAEYSSRKECDAGSSVAQHSHDDVSRDAAVLSKAERSMWHPALQLRSQPDGCETAQQVCTGFITLIPPVPTKAVDVFMNCVNAAKAPRTSLCTI